VWLQGFLDAAVAKASQAIGNQKVAGIEDGLEVSVGKAIIEQQQYMSSPSQPCIATAVDLQQGLAFFCRKLDTAFHGLASKFLVGVEFQELTAKPSFYATPTIGAPVIARLHLEPVSKPPLT
jgi:hypothetical protein